MATMVRPKGLPKKIAYSILGVPSNIQDKKTAAQKEADRKLLYQGNSIIR